MISLDKMRRLAKALKTAAVSGDTDALARVRAVLPDVIDIKHADALHVIAREQGYESWPKAKFMVEALQMDRAEKAERLKMALYFGQHWMVDALLEETPGLSRENLGLACALYDLGFVREALAKDPKAATRIVGVRRPITHLAFSQHINGGGSADAMIAVAEALVVGGADVNDFHNYNNDPNAPLSCLYGALGHARNIVLAEWLLDRGADPNDGESLYHSTEMGSTDGLKLLLKHGARVSGTNAIPRALDFNDHEAVRLLLAAGGDPNEGITPAPSGEPSYVIPALHQAARRMCDAEMFKILLDAGADPSRRYKGVTPYAMAKVYGNWVAADLIAQAGGDTSLTREESLMAMAVDGPIPDGEYLDPDKLPDEFRNMLRLILHLPGKMAHLKRWVALGLEYDRPDEMGVTPVQIAGWEGLPEVMEYFLRLKPDLSHVNEYGGTLLGTIIHGSENNEARESRDHLGCARLALQEGVALPVDAIKFAGQPEMAAFLADWAQAHPGQVVQESP